jgi:hypothetical protein
MRQARAIVTLERSTCFLSMFAVGRRKGHALKVLNSK